MSSTIKQAIEALKSRIADAYTAISAKGGTLPATQDSANLPTAIASIPSGSGVVIDLNGYSFDAAGTNHPKTIYDLIFNNGRIYSVYDENNYDANHGFSIYDQPRINGIFQGAHFINVPNMENLPASFIFGNSVCEELLCPSAAYQANIRYLAKFPSSCFSTNAKLKKVDFGYAVHTNANSDYIPFRGATINLIDVILRIEVPMDVFTFKRCVQTNAIDANSTSLLTPEDIAAGFTSNRQKWNYNLREHIAAYAMDLTNQTTHYIYLPQAQFDALEQDTIDAFAVKNWGLAII